MGLIAECVVVSTAEPPTVIDGTVPQLSELKTVQRIWRVGAKVQTGSQPVTSLVITIPIPTDWPEQQVNLYDEVVPNVARADFRELPDGVTQMVATVPRLAARQQIEIYVLMEITVSEILPPDSTDHLVIPHRIDSAIKKYLNPSPLISHRKINIKRQVKEIVADNPNAWQQVHGFYQWICDNIEIKPSAEVVGAVATLKNLAGHPEDLSNLFIAMCRAHQVPARMVWADNGEYAEFYLVDDSGEGRWFPCVLEGKREFGRMSDPRVIIQKGENIKVPGMQRRQRFVVETVDGKSSGVRPKVQFVRELLPSR